MTSKKPQTHCYTVGSQVPYFAVQTFVFVYIFRPFELYLGTDVPYCMKTCRKKHTLKHKILCTIISRGFMIPLKSLTLNKILQSLPISHFNGLILYIFRQDLENATDYGLAVATSLATVLNRTFQTRIASSSSTSFDKCPQFVSKEKRQKIFGKASKKAILRQHHNFELKQYLQIKYCHHSMELIWGVAPQAYQCTRNNINRTKALAPRPRAQVYVAQCYVFGKSGVEGTLFLQNVTLKT